MSTDHFRWSHGNLSIDVAPAGELKIHFGERLLQPGIFGLAFTSTGAKNFHEVVEAIEVRQGSLTPEQEWLINHPKNENDWRRAQDELVADPENGPAKRDAMIWLYARAFPMMGYFKKHHSVFDDGFYAQGDPLFPQAMAKLSPRDFIVAMTGEYRKSFTRVLLNATDREFKAWCALSKYMIPDDLDRLVITRELCDLTFDYTPFCLRDVAREIPSLISKLLLAPDVSAERVVRTAALLEKIDAASLGERRPRTWTTLHSAIMESASIEPQPFQVEPLPLWTMGKIAAKPIENSQDLLMLSAELDNCLYDSVYTVEGVTGTQQFYKLTEEGTIIGAAMIDLEDKTFEIRGHANDDLGDAIVESFASHIEKALHAEFHLN